jgi:hypothetical protein
MKKYYFFLIILCYFTGYSQIPKAGKYDALNIAIDSTKKTITGYYENKTGENGQFSCIFLFTGNFKSFKDNTILINSFYPGEEEIIQGKIVCNKSTDFSLLLNDDHGGCWNVQSFKDEPVTFTLLQKENWIDIKIIKNSKVYFYTEPEETKKGKAFVLKDDCVKVLEQSGNWLKVVYEANKNTIGWIKSQDCY